MVHKVLLVEDDPTVSKVLSAHIKNALKMDVTCARSYQEAITFAEEVRPDDTVALLDLNLPDAPNGKIVDFITSKNIPAIVFTADTGDFVREHVWSKGIVDYVYKDGGYNIDYVVNLIARINQNKTTKVLVVDAIDSARDHIRNLLEIHQYNVFEAHDGVEALLTLSQHRDIKLVITDYELPKMDGLHLIKEIRKHHTKQEIAIVGLSSTDCPNLSSRFIKYGANDFITTPFSIEEFYCRTSQNIEFIEHFNIIRSLSNTDALTNLKNRRYFFEIGEKLFSNAERKHLKLTVAMVDIDHFKQVNDVYGHDVGDEVIRRVGTILDRRFRRSDVVARFGGEEFCIMASNMDPQHIKRIFEDTLKKISHSTIEAGGKHINVTVSIGVCTTLKPTLDEMIKSADQCLYVAKRHGRNQVVIDSDDDVPCSDNEKKPG